MRRGGSRGSATCSAPTSAPTPSRCAAGRDGLALDGFAGAADLQQAPTRSGNISSSTAVRCATSCMLGAVRARLCRLSAARPPSGGGAVRHDRAARGRRQRASGQDRGAVSRCRAGARDDRRARCRRRSRATARARPRPAAAATLRGVPPGDYAAAGGWDWRALAGTAGSASDGAPRSRMRLPARPRVLPKPRRRHSRSARRPRMPACTRSTSRARCHRPAARRRAGADPRDLHRGPDARRHGDRRPACRA